MDDFNILDKILNFGFGAVAAYFLFRFNIKEMRDMKKTMDTGFEGTRIGMSELKGVVHQQHELNTKTTVSILKTLESIADLIHKNTVLLESQIKLAEYTLSRMQEANEELKDRKSQNSQKTGR